MDLPVRFFEYFFIESSQTFFRLWRNLLSEIEEDLAVELMTRLLFVPLFHDASFVGRILSFFFRLSRILLGLFAYVLATVFVILLAAAWFLFPLLWLTIYQKTYFFLILSIVLLLFIKRLMQPRKTISQLTNPEQLQQATMLHLNRLTWPQILNSNPVHNLLFRLEISPDELTNFHFPQSSEMRQNAFNIAKQFKADFLDAGHLFLASLALQKEGIDHLLLQHELEFADLLEAQRFQMIVDQQSKLALIWEPNFHVRRLGGVNRGWLAAPTPALDSVSKDLTARAAYEEVVEFVGREAQVKEVLRILSSQSSNALVVGPPGAGKTTLARYLAYLIIRGDAPAALATKRLVELDLSRLLAGVQTQGDLALRVDNFFKEVSFYQNIIVFVDEIQNLGLGQTDSQLNLFGLIEPYLESGQFQFLATTEPHAYDQTIEKNSTLARVFQRVDLPPASANESQQFLEDQAALLEASHRIKTTLIAVKKIVQFAQKGIHERVLPDSAVYLYQLVNQEAYQQQLHLLDSSLVKLVATSHSAVPLVESSADQKQQLLNLEEIIHQQFIDQEPAVKAVANTLRRAAANIRESTRPIGTFLFVGPTGVGKTELAKLLSKLYFNDKGHFFRLDMSEYQSPESVSRLIGSDTVSGELTEEINHYPYTLILLDEFEKADPRILTLFLQVLEDGRLTDNAGKVVDFTNTIIIATSNAASLTIAQGLEHGQTVDQLKPAVSYELLKIFKPELINRFDEVVLFKPLEQADLEKIVTIKLEQLTKQMHEQGYVINFSPDLISELARRGYDPVLGARPMRRLIQDTLEARLSRMVLEGHLIKAEPITLDRSYLNV